MKLFAAGIGHKTAPVDLRERLAVNGPRLPILRLCGSASVISTKLFCFQHAIVLKSTERLDRQRVTLNCFYSCFASCRAI